MFATIFRPPLFRLFIYIYSVPSVTSGLVRLSLKTRYERRQMAPESFTLPTTLNNILAIFV